MSHPMLIPINAFTGALEISGVMQIIIKAMNTEAHKIQYALNLRRSDVAQSDPAAAVADDNATK